MLISFVLSDPDDVHSESDDLNHILGLSMKSV